MTEGLPRRCLVLLLAALLAACGAGVPSLPRLAPGEVVLAFGDSLTFGTGARPEESYPAVLEALIGRPVARAGVPGETTEEALRRLPGVLEEQRPRIMILTIGGNDFLRRVPEARVEANLRAMVRLAREQGVAVLLVGVPKPALLAGPPEFYPAIAGEFDLAYEGSVLKDILYDAGAKSDPVHPNAAGYRRMAEALADALKRGGAL